MITGISMLKNLPNMNFFSKHSSAKNLNNFLPHKSFNNKSKKNYKFNDINPIHSDRNFNNTKTRNYKTPNRQYQSKRKNAYMNLNSVKIPNSFKNPKKIESFFRESNSNTNSNSLLNSFKYISSPLIIQQNSDKNSFSPNIIKNQSKKTLILDLDETLVHSAFYPFQIKSDIILKINLDGKSHIIYVLKRPNLDFFLKKISELYNVIIFTASLSEYAEPLIDILDPEKKFGRMFRQNCIKKNGFYIKDLNQFGNNFKDIIIIDNNPISFIMNRDNGLPIMTWYENMNDDELIKFIPLLEFLSKTEDVRPIINQIVNREKNEIDFNIVKKIVSNYKYINDKENYKNNDDFNNLNVIEKPININIYNKENIDINSNNAKFNNINSNYLSNKNQKTANLPNENNKLFYSLSNMSYDEIQNEGYIEYNNLNNENTPINNMNIFNKYSKNLIKNKNKINLFMRTKEIFNLSNFNEKNKLFQIENNKQIDDDNFNKKNNNKDNNDYNKFSKANDNKIIKKGINKNNNLYNFDYGSGKNIYNLQSNNNFNNSVDLKENFYKNNEYKNKKQNILFKYQEQTKIKQHSYDKINNINFGKNLEKSINNISSYRYNSTLNKKIPKNFNLLYSNIYHQNQLYKKPINLKEKNNSQNNYEIEKIMKEEIKEESKVDNSYLKKINERKERLKEIKRKIEEINEDLKNTEKAYYKDGKINNNNSKTSRYIFQRMKLNNKDEKSINEDINIKSYRAQIIDTNINKSGNFENIDSYKKENLFSKKNIYSNINIYRNSKYLYEHKSDSTSINKQYSKRKEKYSYFKDNNLKNEKIKKNSFKYISNDIIKRAIEQSIKN